MALIGKEDQDYLRNEFLRLEKPVRLVLFTNESCASCADTKTLLEETAALSDKISIEVYDLTKDADKAKEYGVEGRAPTIAVMGEKDYNIRFYGIPAGYEFGTLIEDIIDVGRGETGLSDTTKQELAELTVPVHIQVFVTPSCPYCPRAARTAHMMAFESEMVKSDVILANEFPVLSQQYNVMAVPKVVINEKTSFEGAIPEEDFLSFVKQAVA